MTILLIAFAATVFTTVFLLASERHPRNRSLTLILSPQAGRGRQRHGQPPSPRRSGEKVAAGR
jgi:hypothetical protein